MLTQRERYVNCIRLVCAAAFECGTSDRTKPSPGLFASRFVWRDVLVEAEEISGIVLRLDLPKTLPSLLVSFGDPFFLIAAHEVNVHAGLHPGAQIRKQPASPRNIGGVLYSFRPVSQNVQYEGCASVSERGIARADSAGRSTQVGQFNFAAHRWDFLQSGQQDLND